jgi:uncharacterized protein YutE (UPF0331/DUF86 family)
MRISEKRKLYLKQIDIHFAELKKALDVLQYSFEKCETIKTKKELDLDDLEVFEALSARFARTSDILTQKAVKSLLMLLQEDVQTIIDTSNFLEKLGILDQAEDLTNIRELRNQIAHDYVADNINDLFKDVLMYTPILKDIAASLIQYYGNKFGNQ